MRISGGASLTLLLLPLALTGQTQIQEIRTEGNHRLKEPAIVAASGLHLKADATGAELDAAAQRLFATGLFTGVNYRYAPRGSGATAGVLVTLVVTEAATGSTVLIDIPGVDPDQFWKQIEGDTSSLLDRTIPPTPEAAAFYVRQIEAALGKSGRTERLTTQDEVDLVTHKTMLVVQAADRPLITDIGFEGNAAVSTQAIRDHIQKLTVGNSFSERDFRKILDLNVRPLFEEKGFLEVSFPVVRLKDGGDAKSVVTTEINDGRLWHLGKLGVEGDALPVDQMLAAGKFVDGSIANWTEILAGVKRMETVLKRDGYIGANSSAVRTFQPESGRVDVTVKVTKGRQYHFASIELKGLSDADRQKAMGLWKLPVGQPMDAPYVDEFLKSVFAAARPPQHGVSQELSVKDTDQVYLTVSFK